LKWQEVIDNLKIKKENDIVVVYSNEINMFGYGSDEIEAKKDFYETILEYYEYLKANSDRLGKIPARDFEYLKKIL
jgi:hypothetical protein